MSAAWKEGEWVDYQRLVFKNCGHYRRGPTGLFYDA